MVGAIKGNWKKYQCYLKYLVWNISTMNTLLCFSCFNLNLKRKSNYCKCIWLVIRGWRISYICNLDPMTIFCLSLTLLYWIQIDLLYSVIYFEANLHFKGWTKYFSWHHGALQIFELAVMNWIIKVSDYHRILVVYGPSFCLNANPDIWICCSVKLLDTFLNICHLCV